LELVQTELHRHLDISHRLSTLHEWALKSQMVPNGTTQTEIEDRAILKTPSKDLASVIDAFDFFRRSLDSVERLERLAFETCEDCYREGTRKVELRFSPSFVCDGKEMTWDEAVQAFQRGIRRAQKAYSGFRAGLICIATREFGEDSVGETCEFYLRNLNHFVGMDLAGKEIGHPCRNFELAFRPLRERREKDPRVNITIHAGEAAGPESIWEALELLGATRIGHGITALQDPKLMIHLRQKGICLEMCPSSNWITQCVDSIEDHPLPQFIRQNVPVCINTDDPGIFQVSLQDEFQNCREKLGLSEEEIHQALIWADRFSFIQ